MTYIYYQLKANEKWCEWHEWLLKEVINTQSHEKNLDIKRVFLYFFVKFRDQLILNVVRFGKDTIVLERMEIKINHFVLDKLFI